MSRNTWYNENWETQLAYSLLVSPPTKASWSLQSVDYCAPYYAKYFKSLKICAELCVDLETHRNLEHLHHFASAVPSQRPNVRNFPKLEHLREQLPKRLIFLRQKLWVKGSTLMRVTKSKSVTRVPGRCFDLQRNQRTRLIKMMSSWNINDYCGCIVELSNDETKITSTYLFLHRLFGILHPCHENHVFSKSSIFKEPVISSDRRFYEYQNQYDMSCM